VYLKQIEAFVSIVKYKSFSKAAKALHLSQPTISAYIKSLENELGIMLIIRTTNGIFLSEAGTAFHEYASRILHMRNMTHMEMQKYTNSVKGTVHIVSTTFASQYILPRVATKALQKHPDLHFKIDLERSSFVTRAMEELGADFGIVELIPDNPQYVCEMITREPLVLVTPNTPKYQAYGNEFPVETLAKEPFIFCFEGNSLRKVAIDYLKSLGISENELHIVAEMQTVVGILQAVRSNLGITFATKRNMTDYVQDGLCLTFDLPSDILNLPQNIIYHKDKLFSPAANHIIQCLLEEKKNYDI